MTPSQVSPRPVEVAALAEQAKDRGAREEQRGGHAGEQHGAGDVDGEPAFRTNPARPQGERERDDDGGEGDGDGRRAGECEGCDRQQHPEPAGKARDEFRAELDGEDDEADEADEPEQRRACDEALDGAALEQEVAAPVQQLRGVGFLGCGELEPRRQDRLPDEH